MNHTSPTAEERIWSVLAHLSALALGMGILIPVIGWSEQRRKSKYASFHCLQALGYQSLGYTTWLLAYLVLFLVLIVVFAFAFVEDSSPGAVRLWTNLLTLSGFGMLGFYMLPPVIGAISCALGREFRYPWMGKRLAVYLGYEQSATVPGSGLIEEHEERWVVSMSHFAVIIAIWGMIAPFAVWVMQGKRNAFLRFQSIQTSVYHVAANLLYFGALAAAFLSLVPLFTLAGLEASRNGSSPMAMTGLVLFIGLLLIAMVMLLIVPLFHILGQWAGYRILKGDNYRYPLIGRLIERRLESQKQPSSPADVLKENAL